MEDIRICVQRTCDPSAFPKVGADANHSRSVRQCGVEIAKHDQIISSGQSGKKII